MKLKTGFVSRTIAGQTVVLPGGDELNLNLMITLNDTGRFLWEQLQSEITEQQLVSALLREYDVDPQTAADSVTRFLEELRKYDFLE